jgi:hypothetical protein
MKARRLASRKSSHQEVRDAGGSLFQLPVHADARGTLVVLEEPSGLPFVPRRTFFIVGVANDQTRAGHGHILASQVLVAAQGTVTVEVSNGHHDAQVILDVPDVALHIPPRVRIVLSDFSPDAVLLCVVSAEYDPDDYFQSFDELPTVGHG